MYRVSSCSFIDLLAAEINGIESVITRKQSETAGTSAKVMLFARWRHRLWFCSGSRMPPLTQW